VPQEAFVTDIFENETLICILQTKGNEYSMRVTWDTVSKNVDFGRNKSQNIKLITKLYSNEFDHIGTRPQLL